MNSQPSFANDRNSPVDATARRRQEVATRLKTVEGQVRGVRRMVTEGEGCVAIANQASAALEGLRSAMRLVLRNYLEECLDVDPDPTQRQAAYDRLIAAVEQFIR